MFRPTIAPLDATAVALYTLTMLPNSVKCYLVTRDDSRGVRAGIAELPLEDLPQGDVLIRVAFSSLNYKDALAARGHQGIVKRFPHVPGVDAAGTVVASDAKEFRPGDEVLVTGHDLGAAHWGGWAEFVRVPHEWVLPLVEGLSHRQAMILGTAGLTAAFCVDALQRHGVEPAAGPVVVTGASGGVGSFAVAVLGKLGYHVVAVTGKAEAHAYLRRLGRLRSSPATRLTTAAADRCCPGGGPAALIPWAETSWEPCSARCGIVVALPPADWPAATSCR